MADTAGERRHNAAETGVMAIPGRLGRAARALADRARKVAEAEENAVLGRMREGQSTDSNNE